MRILGLDTATATASVALVEDGRIVADEITRENASHRFTGVSTSNHAEIVLPLIRSALEKAGATIADLTALAVSVGPGSFTGVRIGLSTIKGLSYGSSIPVLGFSTLLANAARVGSFEGLICSLFDARKKQVYAAVFRRDRETLARITADSLTEPKTLLARIREIDPTVPCLFVGDGVNAYADLLLESPGNRVSLNNGEGLPSIASAIARLAQVECGPSGGRVPTTLAPVYLRLPEAEEKAKNSVSG